MPIPRGRVSSSTGATPARRSILDDSVFAGLATAKTPSPQSDLETASAAKRDKARLRDSNSSLWAGAAVENDLPKGSKGKERASVHSSVRRSRKASTALPEEEQQDTTAQLPLTGSTLIPPYPYLADRSAAVTPLPFPLRASDEPTTAPLAAGVYSELTPPRGSDGSLVQDDEDHEEDAEHHSHEEEEEDDLSGLDLEGFVVGEEDDEEEGLGEEEEVIDEAEDTEHQLYLDHEDETGHGNSPPRAPRISDENGGSGSISSFGQPISSTFPFVMSEAVPRRSQSIGSTGSPLSHGEYNVDEEGRWEYSPAPSRSASHSHSHPNPHSAAASSVNGAGTRSRASSARSHVALDPPPRHPSAGSSLTRRRRADTFSSTSSPLASSQGSSDHHGGFGRPRTISMQDATFGVQNPLPPVHGTEEHDLYDDDDDEDGDADLRAIVEEDRQESGAERNSGEISGPPSSRGGSLDEGEREDSVGLLSSKGPSPKSSMGVLRSRAGSLVSLSKRRSSHGSMHSSPSAAFVSAQSASASPTSPPGSLPSVSGRRSRKTSAVSATNGAPYAFPVPVRSTSGSESPGSGLSRRASAIDDEDHTFGFQRPVNWDNVPRLSSAGPSRHVSLLSGQPPPLPMPSLDARRSLRPSPSRSTSGRSEETTSQAPATTELLNEAPSSYVTAAPTMASTTDSAGAGTVRSYRPLDDISRELM